MDADVMIRAEGLGKKYVIGHQSNERYTALRDVLARSARNFVRGAGDMLRGKPIYAGDELEEFWALKGVSFEIKRGDVVGIIGRNGAGKSTLLKVLSRITEPTEGRVQIRGKVASLLEVGTGFHPELTGRENIFLNGAILGMKQDEIRRKFDEIVDFAGVDKFLDTPVKRFSSGMYVRLAFSVAAHLEPDILVVDEVLAVGDAEFQKKCIGKMGSVAGHGRTVLFVSHNLHSIGSLCKSGLLVVSGRVAQTEDVGEAITRYREANKIKGGSTVTLSAEQDLQPDGAIAFSLNNLPTPLPPYEVRFMLRSQYGEAIAFASCGGFYSPPLRLQPNDGAITGCIEAIGLAEGLFYLEGEIVDCNTSRVIAAAQSEEFQFTPKVFKGETYALGVSHNRGFFRLPLRL